MSLSLLSLIRFAYNCLLYALLPFLPLRLLWRSRKNPDYRLRWRERFALYGRKESVAGSIWLHAVSLGEAVAATPLVHELKQKYPNTPLVFTVMTPTGFAYAAKAFGDSVILRYVPYDYPDVVARFLSYANPKFFIIMETELWPNILRSCKARRIPVFLVNARLTAHSFKGYSMIRSFTMEMLQCVDLIFAQSQKDADYFLNLGARRQQVSLAGNMKFDAKLPLDNIARGRELGQQLSGATGELIGDGDKIRRPIWIAASTHPEEEEMVLAAHVKVMQQLPQAILILVPRHLNRADEIEELCTTKKLHMMRYDSSDPNALLSLSTPMLQAVNVILVDVIGQLLLFYAAADVAFVGGSLVPVGGHNVLEPAALALPIVVGPYTETLAGIRTLLENANGLMGVTNATELSEQVVRLLQDTVLRKKCGSAAYQVVEQNKGISEMVLNKIEEYVAKQRVALR